MRYSILNIKPFKTENHYLHNLIHICGFECSKCEEFQPCLKEIKLLTGFKHQNARKHRPWK